jgi:SynChlorMet cassette radical SAM/SPASM protein ScmF
MNICDLNEQSRTDTAPFALRENVPPLRAFYLYLSTSCNLACRHCWITPRFVDGQPLPGDVIDLELLRQAVVEAKTLGLISVKLTGGEPMLHPHFLAIVDQLTAQGLDLNMETNGTLLTANIAHHLREHTNLRLISISLDGANATTHDSFRNVPGAWHAALRGLGHLVQAGYTNIQVIMSVHHGNLDQIEALISLAVSQGAASVKFSPVTAVGRGAAMQVRGETLDFDETLALARHVRALRHDTPIPLILHIPLALRPASELLETGSQVGSCGVLGILGILGTGEIALCGIGRTVPELMYGRLGQDSIRDIWLEHPRLLELRNLLQDVTAYPGVCSTCVMARRCRTACVASNYARAERLTWPNPLCEEAERRGVFPVSRKR